MTILMGFGGAFVWIILGITGVALCFRFFDGRFRVGDLPAAIAIGSIFGVLVLALGLYAWGAHTINQNQQKIIW
ncbi:hypothetical protein F1188_16035 [Roseospira marina]|uniref:Uncharacterized protein n=1 Tax=Roseospira marina TaxID=140057 RepID=A0A5M6I7Z9_9PROT|nr:hypothetical protein [Roseospira marina]KAA5604370.1 hypothetical protein F1188_16035 [Roseospira marina]MBB4315444.1 hypothetical protein [Roseospira marina]MBB5088410.1 ABC-type antimicrobial peptide transport system permease subunit [Roseospira marina]